MLVLNTECTEYLCACFCWPENMAGVYILSKNLWVKGVKGFIGKYQTLLQRGGENLNMNQWEEPREGKQACQARRRCISLHTYICLKYQLKVSACVHLLIVPQTILKYQLH